MLVRQEQQQQQQQQQQKHENTTNMPFFTRFFVPWDAETTANSEVFEGQEAKNTVIDSVF